MASTYDSLKLTPLSAWHRLWMATLVETLIDRGKALNYGTLYVGEIYKDNLASQSAFEGAGFVRYKETEKGYQYCLNLEDS
jgi:hypothetical protein